MADTYTTNLNLTKPEPGAAEDTWGISLNADLDALDAIFSSTGTQVNLNANQINFAQNKKAIFGTNSDLQIYHDGSNANIVDTGTGYLSLRGTDLRLQDSTGWNFVICTDLGQGGEVALLHSNIQKLKTTSTGIDVTGNIELGSSHFMGDEGGAGQSENLYIKSSENNDVIIRAGVDSDSIRLQTSATDRFTIDAGGVGYWNGTSYIDSSRNLSNLGTISSGAITSTGNSQMANLVVTGDLTVQGTTTSVNTDDLNVKDKNITLNYSTGDSSASANGAGITIQDAVSATQDATLTWNTANDSFNFSHNLNFADNVKAQFGSSALQIYSNGTNSYIAEGGTGDLLITTNGTGIRLQKNNGENMIKALTDGAVQLYYDNQDKLTTTSTGIDVTGTVTSDGLEARKDTGSTTNSLLKLTNSAGSTTDGVGITFEVANTSGAGGSVNVVRDGSNFKPYMTLNTSANISTAPSQRVRIDDTGIDVTGTVTSDGLTVDGETFSSNGTYGTKLTYSNGNQSGVIDTFGNHNLEFRANNDRAMNIASNGDISFYEDTGTTQAFFWDASAENLGLGDTAPQDYLEINGSGRGLGGLTISNSSASHAALSFARSSTATARIKTSEPAALHTSALHFQTSDASGGSPNLLTAMYIDENQRVGIGTTSPRSNYSLDVRNAGNSGVNIQAGDEAADIALSVGSAGTPDKFVITSGGSVGIGTTSPNATLEATKAITFSNIDTIGQFLIKSASGATGDMLNFGVDSTNSLAFIQANEKGVDTIPLVLQRYGGNVGIGTTSPSFSLDVRTADNNVAQFKSTDASATVFIADNASSSAIRNNLGVLTLSADEGDTSSGTAIVFQTDTAERARINSSGNVGIGTSSPQAKLESYVSGNFSTTYNDFSGDGLYIQTNGTVADGEYTAGISFSRTVGNNARVAGIAGVQEGSDADKTGLAFFTHPSTGTADALQESLRLSADGSLGIGTSSPSEILTLDDTDPKLALRDAGIERAFLEVDSADNFVINNKSISSMIFETSDTERMRIDSSGNIGIGLTNPSEKLEVSGKIKASGQIRAGSYLESFPSFSFANDTDTGMFSDTANQLEFSTGGSSRLVIDPSGNVGIGSTSVRAKLDIVSSTSATPTDFNASSIFIEETGNNKYGGLTFVGGNNNGITGTVAKLLVQNTNTAGGFEGAMIFSTRNSSNSMQEAMRIDSSGTLLVGKTSTTVHDVGTFIGGGGAVGLIEITRDENYPLRLNRKTSDGQLLRFDKDGSTVGSIGSHTSTTTNMYIGSVDSGLYFDSTNNRISPYYVNNNSLPNGGISLGGNSNRFQDLHLSGTGYFGTNIAINAGNKIQLSGATDSTHHIYHDSSTDYDVVNYSTGFQLEHHASGTQFTLVGATGNVGIGTGGPNTNLHIYDGSGGATLKIESNLANAYDSSKIQLLGGNLSTSEILLGDASSATVGRIIYRHNGNSLAFDVNSSERMRIDSSGNVGIGTSSPSEKLHVLGNTKITGNITVGASHTIGDVSAVDDNFLIASADNKDLTIKAGVDSSTLRLKTTNTALTIDAEGLVTIEEATTINDDLTINATTPSLNLIDTNNNSDYAVNNANGVFQIFDKTNDVSRLSVTSAGLVGIGTSSPLATLHVGSGSGSLNTAAQLFIPNNDALMRQIKLGHGSGVANITADDSSKPITLSAGGSERMRIDSSGKLFLNSTSVTAGYTGAHLIVGGQTSPLIKLQSTHGAGSAWDMYATSGTSLIFARNQSDKVAITSAGRLGIGTSSPETPLHVKTAKSSVTDSVLTLQDSSSTFGKMIEFVGEGSTDCRGIIGFQEPQSNAPELYITNGGTESAGSGVGLAFWQYISTARISPCDSLGDYRDNAIDLGWSNARFDDIYATNGTIQTSDRNEKQDIQALTEAEQRVATACKGLIRRFRWQDSVEKKDNNPDSDETARLHFGVIAQDLQDAFEAEGLDAGDYGMFISQTWEDDDGNEQTRLGVRYNELLAFIITTL